MGHFCHLCALIYALSSNPPYCEGSVLRRVSLTERSARSDKASARQNDFTLSLSVSSHLCLVS